MTERYDCHYCKESLFGKKYVLREENPYCVKCYESLYSNTCEDCKKPIGCNTRDLSYKDRHWHEECFQCFQCKRSLVDKPFSTKDDQLLCTECYSNEYSSKCHECKKTIMPGSRKMEHKGNSWHETCFTCQRCQQPIGTKSFIPKENQNFCVPCYEKQFAMQCVHCKKVWVAVSTSPLKSVSGTMTASTVGSAQSPWWAEVSSPSVTTSCALSVAKTSDWQAASGRRI
ncbi:four and a half LIM domains protein 2-like isoform X4 [Oncorhynchus nerka]|uniref:four and a half LIM domains protein 2-like isoform X4 n=1 Tax=Oncorhynchus nerka TaxID=8023 RepID=UPI0011300920|nr:four and a half LIM domains protein 2-like isoform X4 [Oncorhynchus nerka]